MGMPQDRDLYIYIFKKPFYCEEIFREWTDMPQDREFRCFASHRTLHAISQYHCYTVFPSLQDESEVLRIRDSILAFHNSVCEALPMPDYVRSPPPPPPPPPPTPPPPHASSPVSIP